MIEITVLDYLNSVLDVPVSMEKPTNNPKEYVVIEKTGTDNENHIYSAMFAVQSYAKSMYEASSLNEKVKEAMIGNGFSSYGITAHTDISKCRLNSDYNFTDTTTKEYRYQAVFEVWY